MDMQHRLVLEHTYSAIHSSGRSRMSIRGQAAMGVYVGIWADAGWSSVLNHSAYAKSPYRVSAASCSMAAGRVSYTLGLRGPSFSVDTACTAGLTACHIACGAIRCAECDSALAAGVNLNYCMPRPNIPHNMDPPNCLSHPIPSYSTLSVSPLAQSPTCLQ